MFSKMFSYLLFQLAIGEDVFKWYRKLSEIVLPKPIFIPAYSLQDKALRADRQVERNIPFGV